MSADEEQKAQDLAKAIRALGDVFIGRLPVTLSAMEDELHRIQKDPQDQTPWKTLHRHLHSLAGSGGTFGYHDLSDRARALELRVNDILKTNDVTSEPARSAFLEDQRALMSWVVEHYVHK
jgi:chemotaxis protein histidine kinase CheA